MRETKKEKIMVEKKAMVTYVVCDLCGTRVKVDDSESFDPYPEGWTKVWNEGATYDWCYVCSTQIFATVREIGA